MDNLTHSLIGIAAAEALVTTRKKPRLPLWIASVLANNLPDSDVFHIWSGPHDKLDYLLHHRGYTHTILMAPLQSLVLLLGIALYGRGRPAFPLKEIAFLVFLGPLLHLFADSWNVYGVHPFWPLDNRWFYGDLIFIVEPWLWVAFLPLCWARSSSRAGKGFALTLLLFLVGIVWYHPFVTMPVAIAVTTTTLAWTAAQKYIHDDRHRLLIALSLCIGVFSAFSAAKLSLSAKFKNIDREVALVAHPGNALCWTVLSAGFEGESYTASAWVASSWPALLSAGSCPRQFSGTSSAELQPIPGASKSRESIPIGQFRGTRTELAELSRSCRTRAFLRFARIPFWFTLNGQKFLGDLRFDRDRGVGFAEIPLVADDATCERFNLPWIGRFFPAET